MAEATTQEQAVVAERADHDLPDKLTSVDQVPEELRAEIAAKRESGLTLVEIKRAFPQVASDVIVELLPAATKREAAKREPKPKAQPKPRYIEGDDRDRLAADVLAARKRVGRPTLATFMGVNESTSWRWETGRIHPGEVEAVRTQLARIAAGELPEPAPKATREPKAPIVKKADLEARLAAVAKLIAEAQEHSKAGTATRKLLDQAADVLNPPTSES